MRMRAAGTTEGYAHWGIPAEVGVAGVHFGTGLQGLTFTVFANKIIDIANMVIPFLIGLALVAVIWGIFKYVAAGDNTERIEGGRRVIIWGIIALFVMLSFWGLVTVVHTSLFGS